MLLLRRNRPDCSGVLLYGEGKKGHVAGSFYCLRQLALVFRAVSGDPPGHDLSPLAHIFPELFHIFVIDMLYFIHAEETYLGASFATPASAPASGAA